MAQKTSQSSDVISEPYKTIVPPKEETLQYLRGWKPPRTAYVLFEAKWLWCNQDGSSRWGTGLFTLNVENRADLGHHLDRYIAKGFRILDYGNFPKFNDQNPERAKKALHYSSGAGVNPWDNLERQIKVKIQQDTKWEDERNVLQNELNVLRQKLAQEEKKKQIKEQSTLLGSSKESMDKA